jgi:hypothetical protein
MRKSVHTAGTKSFSRNREELVQIYILYASVFHLYDANSTPTP